MEVIFQLEQFYIELNFKDLQAPVLVQGVSEKLALALGSDPIFGPRFR